MTRYKPISEFLDKIICGDALEVLKQMPSDSVDCIITSPPYWGLRDYGEATCKVWGGDPDCKHEWEYHDGKKLRGVDDGKWKESISSAHLSGGAFCKKCGAWYGQLGLEPTLDMYIEHLLEITAELKRVLKPTGTLWWNHGDSYFGGHPGGSIHGEICGNRYGDKSMIPQQKEGRPQGSPIYRKMEKCLVMQNYRLILHMIDEQGWILRNIIIWYKPNHMPSSVKDRFTNAYEPVFMLTKSKKYWFDLDAVRVPHSEATIKRQKYGWDLENAKWAKTKDGSPVSQEHNPYGMPHPLGKNPGDLWEIPTEAFPDAHFATFPKRLVEPMVKASCPQWICKKCGFIRERITKTEYIKHRPSGGEYLRKDVGEKRAKTGNWGTMANNLIAERYTIGWTDCGCGAGWDSGIVLDPFAGSGTTCLVAKKLGRHYIGIELNPEYVKMAKKRINFGERLEKFGVTFE